MRSALKRRELIDAVLRDDAAGVVSSLQAGTPADSRDPEHNETALMLARSDSVRRLLLEAGADVNAVDNRGRTAFSLSFAPILLENGASANLPDSDGNTPLFHAVATGDPDIVRRLLDSGADPDHRNEAGETAADVAERFGFAAILAMLNA